MADINNGSDLNIQSNDALIAAVWHYLHEVQDPEIPVIDVVELGVVREVLYHQAAQQFEIIITPTYSGCPATKTIADDIAAKLREKGVTNFTLTTVLSPAWTSDWISVAAREKLRQFGIAPPEAATADIQQLKPEALRIACPHCGSRNTTLISPFGSTPCKSLHRCQTCLEPFDYFKCH